MGEGTVDSEQQPMESKKPEDYFFRASASDFKKVPSSPIAYWVSDNIRIIYAEYPLLGSVSQPRVGMRTGDNDRFLRQWHEVDDSNFNNKSNNSREAINSKCKWFPFVKGGNFRKWFGNVEQVVNWYNDGEEIKKDTLSKYPQLSWDNLGWKISNEKLYFKPAITWSAVSSSYFGVRFIDAGNIFGTGGSCIFPEGSEFELCGALLCSKLGSYFLEIGNPTLNINVEDVSAIPVKTGIHALLEGNTNRCVVLSRIDWNSYETSWGFTSLPLLQSDFHQSTLKDTYQKLRLHWFNMTMKMQQLEEENNRIFIEAYGLQDELEPDVPLKEITLTCNPFYRYGKEVASDQWPVVSEGEELATGHSPLITNFPLDKELEERLLADTMKEFISYAVGCMFGRYSLDKEGLILANQGETLADYYEKVGSDECEVRSKNSSLGEAHPPLPTSHSSLSFTPDDDNVIPILDGEWFTDDVTERFRRFVKVTFGEEHYQENLAFIEQSIGKDIRKYFLKDFYADHVKRYKKRPIYWMFSSGSSGRGGSFNALIYMHRYQPTTASVVLNGYLREFRTKLIARKEHLEQVSISASVSQRDKTQALKEIEKLKKMIDELELWEREVLYPLAAEQIDIDLDDGVKLNYPKFGKALKKIVGLS